jgi:hypothetical protein
MRRTGALVVSFALLSSTPTQAQVRRDPSGPARVQVDTIRVDPVGLYNLRVFVSVSGAMPDRPATLSISGSPGKYQGTFTPESAEPATIRSVESVGTQLTILLDTPAGPSTLKLVFKGDSLSGTIVSSFGSFEVAGRRAPP